MLVRKLITFGRCHLALALLGIWLSLPAGAEVVASTQISYYTVGGKTPEAIFWGFMNRGPHVNGAQAIASIATRASQDGGLAKDGGSCRLTDYRIDLKFLVNRPRIANPSVLSASDRAAWEQMNSFIIAHENQHKRIWMTCADALDRHVSRMSASSCAQLLAKGAFMWKQMLSVCDKNQSAFDSVQSWELMQLPFMRKAHKGRD